MADFNKSAWTARLLGIILLLVFTFLFWNLYSNLVRLQREVTSQPAPTPVEGAQTP